ncbi:MAG: SpoIID/LytB domain-containing protein [Cyanobacteria bacterium]|nr:SpoIID/LytB domain-containing protein [Cyanobacteriota bacterium]
MQVSVGLTTTDLSSLNHTSLTVTAGAPLHVFQFAGNRNLDEIVRSSGASSAPILTSQAGQHLEIKPADGDKLHVKTGAKASVVEASWLIIAPTAPSSISIHSIKRSGQHPVYRGRLAVWQSGGKLRFALICDLDEYLGGVLHSEIPASYHPEAIKAQAVAARTYGLNPRIDHRPDFTNVCDSFLCCQYFAGAISGMDSRHLSAIKKTAGEVLTFADRPALALFSSCAGGHTENYDNCFSDPKTAAFPPQPIPYLRGVPETASCPPSTVFDESALRKLYYNHTPHTVDAWSNHFRWSVTATANDLESFLHATAEKLHGDAATSPFVIPPPSGKFGHINSFRPVRRGVAGTIIELEVVTSHGTWKFLKELVIRDLFKMPSIKLARLKSARMFFETENEKGLIKQLHIRGLGWGHGVGLQQTGSQGWAKAGRDYRFILGHYFPGTSIQKM